MTHCLTHGKTSLLLLLALLCVPAGPIQAQDKEKPQPPKGKMTPRQVMAKAYQLAQEAKKAYEAGQYDQAARTCRQIIGMVARAPNTQLMLARCQMKLGSHDQALAALEKAVEDGLTGAEKLEEDLFDPLRKDKRFQGVLAKLQESDRRAKQGLEPVPVKVPGVKTVEGSPSGGFPWRIRMDPEATPDKPQRLLIWLHPSGGSMNPTIERLSPHFIEQGYAVLVVAAKPWRYWTSKHIETFVDKTLPDAARTPGLDARKPVLLGYSAGGQAALQMWTSKPEAYGGLILDASYPSDMAHWRKTRQHRVQKVPGKDGTSDTPIFVLVGGADPGARLWRQAQKAWKDKVPLEVHYVPGQGHTWLLGPEQFQALKKWLQAIEPLQDEQARE